MLLCYIYITMTRFILTDEIFYHGTRAKFNQFRPLSHFGTAEAADTILDSIPTVKKEKLNGMDDLKSISQPTAPLSEIGDRKIIPVRLNLHNTYEMQDIAACHDFDTYKSFTAYHIAHDLKLGFIPHFFDYIFNEPFELSHEEITRELASDNLYAPASSRENRYHLAFQRMIQYFESIGYDGFHYVNQYEDPGHISYIVFRPENVIRQDMQNTETRTPGTRTYKPSEILPAHDMSHNHKRALMLEESHHSQLFTQKINRHKNQTDPEHAAKTKIYYTKIFYQDILPKLKKISKQTEFGYHGLTHTEQTVLYGLDLAITCAYDPMPVMLACALHDIRRTNSAQSDDHASKAVPFARKFLYENYPMLPYATVEEIINAIKNHSDGKIAKDLTAACMWDADRIRLSWDGIYRPEYFTTLTGKYIADLPPLAKEAYIKRQNNMLIENNIKTPEQIAYEQKMNKLAIQREFDIKYR